MNSHNQQLFLQLLLLACFGIFSASGFFVPATTKHATTTTTLGVASAVPPVDLNLGGVFDNNNKNGGEIVDSYEPSVTGGCVRNVENHVRLLDKSLKKSSGKGLFEWIQSKQDPGEAPIATAAQLDADTRFGLLSHGTQPDPVYNYGNRASLELFEQSLERLCQTPSRFSTVPRLMRDRKQSIQNIERNGYGTIERAIRISAKGSLFCIADILVWTVKDDDNRRIGLAAIYDRKGVVPCSNTNIL